MVDHHRYVASENIERFQSLLRNGRLDRQQRETVKSLLAQARADLALLEQDGGQSRDQLGSDSHTPLCQT